MSFANRPTRKGKSIADRVRDCVSEGLDAEESAARVLREIGSSRFSRRRLVKLHGDIVVANLEAELDEFRRAEPKKVAERNEWRDRAHAAEESLREMRARLRWIADAAPDYSLGVDENMERLREIARARDVFERCVERAVDKDGVLKLRCKKGFWCVSGKNHQQVEVEAVHYWRQYEQDGEYEDILRAAGDQSPAVMMERNEERGAANEKP
jgi:hypothetical protein